MSDVIHDVSELLTEIRNKGVREIEPYLEIAHNPTIGAMYEGLTKRITRNAIFTEMNMKVVSGKITNSERKYSRQIDCMIVTGEGEKIPYTQTDEYIYDINQVIMVIEVKKNLHSDELSDGYDNLRSVIDVQAKNYRDLRLDPIEDAFMSIAGMPLPGTDQINSLDHQKKMLYHSLVVEALLPLRVIFGFSGFKTELSLRNKFIEYLSRNLFKKGYGPVSFPNLIISGDNAIIKTNGMPYGINIFGTEDYCWLASYRENPILLFLELLWTRLTYHYGLSPKIFGNETRYESIAPLMTIRALSGGWSYTPIPYTQKELDFIASGHEEWQPPVLTEDEFIVMNHLCRHGNMTAKELNALAKDQPAGEIIAKLTAERLVYVQNDIIQLMTKNCICVIVPDYGFVAADDFDGRLTNWLNKRMS